MVCYMYKSSHFLFGSVLVLVILRGKCMNPLLCVSNKYYVVGVDCFSLSSSPISSDDGHIIACPHTTVTLTCTATYVGSMTMV